jgi:hypothetical protein
VALWHGGTVALWLPAFFITKQQTVYVAKPLFIFEKHFVISRKVAGWLYTCAVSPNCTFVNPPRMLSE